jgi:hypothetical protein
MHVGSVGGPDTIDACAKAALAHNAIVAVAAARTTWIPESMLSPFCWIELTDCRRTRLVANGRRGVRDAGNLADRLQRNGIGPPDQRNGSFKGTPRSETEGMRDTSPSDKADCHWHTRRRAIVVYQCARDRPDRAQSRAASRIGKRHGGGADGKIHGTYGRIGVGV